MADWQTFASAMDRAGFDDWSPCPPIGSQEGDSEERDAWEASRRAWINAGHHADMDYLRRNADMAFHPDRLEPSTASLIVCMLNYHQGPRVPGPVPEGHGRIAMYAWGRDYHKVFRNKFKALVQDLNATFGDAVFRTFADSDPLHERFFAVRAGLGFIGRHSLLITPDFGSKVLLGILLTSIDVGLLEGFPGFRPRRAEQCPSACRRCIDACPGKAIEPDRIVDARKCISWRTIEARTRGSGDIEPDRDGWVFGCDACQDSCPYSVRNKECREADFRTHRAGPSVPLEDLCSLSDHATLERRFGGSPLMRAGLEGLQYNARILMDKRAPLT